jgi:hypothetical protein
MDDVNLGPDRRPAGMTYDDLARHGLTDTVAAQRALDDLGLFDALERRLGEMVWRDPRGEHTLADVYGQLLAAGRRSVVDWHVAQERLAQYNAGREDARSYARQFVGELLAAWPDVDELDELDEEALTGRWHEHDPGQRGSTSRMVVGFLDALDVPYRHGPVYEGSGLRRRIYRRGDLERAALADA